MNIDLSHVIAHLEDLREAQVQRLRAGNPGALSFKQELDLAIDCLKLCERYGLSPKSTVSRLPEPITRTPSSEFRVIEDHELDDRSAWTEVTIDGEPLRPLPGALLIEPG